MAGRRHGRLHARVCGCIGRCSPRCLGLRWKHRGLRVAGGWIADRRRIRCGRRCRPRGRSSCCIASWPKLLIRAYEGRDRTVQQCWGRRDRGTCRRRAAFKGRGGTGSRRTVRRDKRQCYCGWWQPRMHFRRLVAIGFCCCCRGVGVCARSACCCCCRWRGCCRVRTCWLGELASLFSMLLLLLSSAEFLELRGTSKDYVGTGRASTAAHQQRSVNHKSLKHAYFSTIWGDGRDA